jgi:hypothetical protein
MQRTRTVERHFRPNISIDTKKKAIAKQTTDKGSGRSKEIKKGKNKQKVVGN